MLCILGAMFLFTSCKSPKDTIDDENIQNQEDVDANKENEPTDIPEESSKEENPPTIVVESGPVIDEEAVLDYFYGQSKKALTDAGYLLEEVSETDGQPTKFVCIKDEMELGYTYEHGENSNYIYYIDHRENLGQRYKDVLEAEYIDNEISQKLESVFPKEYYKHYLPKDVRKKCLPFAEACGYGDAKVDIYAIKHEVLNELENNDASQDENKIVWTKEHDAYLLVYQTKVEEYVIDSTYYNMMYVFVPAYDRIVYAQAYRSLVVTETVEEENLLTAENMIAEMLRVFNITNPEDLIIHDFSLVYSPRYEMVNNELERKMIEPCWRFEYALSENVSTERLQYHDIDGTIFMGAKDGSIFKYKTE